MKLVLNQPLDISPDFFDFSSTCYLADNLASFDPASASGRILYKRHEYVTGYAFNNMQAVLKPVPANEFPKTEYTESPELPFSLEFITPRTVRFRAASGFTPCRENESLMLAGGSAPAGPMWQLDRIEGSYRYSSPHGSVTVLEKPWRLEFRDAAGKLLTHTHNAADSGSIFSPILPFSFVRRASDYSRSFAASFSLSPDEKIFGCGESFTKLDKRGRKVVLWTTDACSVQSERMYKPIPFFMSSRGYGLFMHTSSPITCDFGKNHSGMYSLMIGDDSLDLFIFLGSPKEILDEYTSLTGKPAMPPLWSFGLWMSRITYSSEEQVRDVAARLRNNRIPCDVIHLDTGWFETDWRCDYEFSTTRFKDPEAMLSDLKKNGFRVSLWQLPYFVPNNKLFGEIVEKGLAVRDAGGNLPTEDAILDFSNPKTVEWYQRHIASLLRLGASAIKVDFGEAAPLGGIYASGRTGFYEHNLYPLRYNKAVADVTRQVTGQNIIWARSAWAGSQRYPLHWGGDAECTDTGMEGQLRGGLSFGLSGFAFWSHDIGGFVKRPSPDLYLRWLAFGVLSSHSRCHGAPPREPWEYGPDFMDRFRIAVELKYALMPYIYAQAKLCTRTGLPMLRALFIEFPDDPGSWLIEDQYLFGSDILVAPLLHSGSNRRDVYLPPGKWFDFQTGREYSSGWHSIEAGPVRAVILIRDGAVIPQMSPAQSTGDLDWTHLKLVAFCPKNGSASGLVCLPQDNQLRQVKIEVVDGNANLVNLNRQSDTFARCCLPHWHGKEQSEED